MLSYDVRFDKIKRGDLHRLIFNIVSDILSASGSGETLICYCSWYQLWTTAPALICISACMCHLASWGSKSIS